MRINSILTERGWQKAPFYDIVYEWEDQLSCSMQAKLFYAMKREKRENRWLRRLPLFGRFAFSNQNILVFDMDPLMSKIRNKQNIVPCIVDFFIKEENLLKSFYAAYSKSKFVLISSKEVYDFLKHAGCPLNIIHWPLSIPDVYKINRDTKFEKKYDLVLMGRQNTMLQQFVERYASLHPDFIYVYRKQEAGSFVYYTNQDEKVGEINTRVEYINLMRQARIGLYATPGIDGGEVRTNGFNQVTPRFLEYIACGCHVIARYASNSDTEYYGLNQFSSSIESYVEFEESINYDRTHEVDMQKYSAYLEDHYTSVRASQLQEYLKGL